jgi:glycosyltransferase involved in cell wall biosynthesis
VSPLPGVSFVVPVHNGAAHIQNTLKAIMAQADGRPMEVIVVDDQSQDNSLDILRQLARHDRLRVIQGEGQGMSAALNLGIGAASFPLICQVDQDVLVGPGWMRQLVAELDDPTVAAAQGCFTTDPDASLCSRVMGLDLQWRYVGIRGPETDHVCTGNSVYRVDALRRVGLFDESLGYGCDNDMSYRLRAAGYRLIFSRSAHSRHSWREGLSGYLVQQYGFGYGRLDLVAKHPSRCCGDTVSPMAMMAHPIVMAAALALAVSAAGAAFLNRPWQMFMMASVSLAAGLTLERLAAGIRAWRTSENPAALLFPLVHFLRDISWVAAIGVWSVRRVLRRRSTARHSMRGRTPLVRKTERPLAASASSSSCARMLAVIPAHNEAANLPSVIRDLRLGQPDLDILVVDDGSSDGTAALLPQLGVRWLQWPTRRGIGPAMRAGLRYALRAGFEIVVRLDADGQHGIEDIEQLLLPVREAQTEVALGSRFVSFGEPPRGIVGMLQRVLAGCLSVQTRRRITDPTSGFYVLGPRAIRVLAEHHPGGYPEPELRLFLSRNLLNVIEVPVSARTRLSGRTSLTAGRLLAASVRVLLAMLMVPLRPIVALHE